MKSYGVFLKLMVLLVLAADSWQDSADVIQSGVDRYKNFDDRINQLELLINEVYQLALGIKRSTANVDSDWIRARFKQDWSVPEEFRDAVAQVNSQTRQDCYNKILDYESRYAGAEEYIAEFCFTKRLDGIDYQYNYSLELQNVVTSGYLRKGPERITRCANDPFQSASECVENILFNTDQFLTRVTVSAQELLYTFPKLSYNAFKCIQKFYFPITSGNYLLNSYLKCMGIVR